MITENQFEEGIQKNINRINRYESGMDGSGGGCDCIGLIIGAIRLMGGKWNWTHGTNYTVRNRMNDFRAVSSEKELKENDLVFKAKNPGEDGYSLPEKYKPGGSEYNGDIKDYYHVGVVRSVSPLRITHCTTVNGGIKVDTTLGKWRYAGWLDQIEGKNEGKNEMRKYEVIGGSLKLRKGPSTNSAVLKLIPNGAIVTSIDEEENGWLRVSFDGTDGYCMVRYLHPCDSNMMDDDSIAAAIEVAFENVESALQELKMLITSVL